MNKINSKINSPFVLYCSIYTLFTHQNRINTEPVYRTVATVLFCTVTEAEKVFDHVIYYFLYKIKVTSTSDFFRDISWEIRKNSIAGLVSVLQTQGTTEKNVFG